MSTEWGPLAALAGEWEGEAGVDRPFSHAQGRMLDTPYREKCLMTPFGPVDNGRQSLFGPDYRTAMWRGDEENPATAFTLSARLADPSHGTAANACLSAHASARACEVAIAVDADGWGYDQTTTLRMDEFPDPVAQTDHHRLRRVG